MTDTAASLLVVDGDRDFGWMLSAEAEARGYYARAVASVTDALRHIGHERFDAVLVDLGPGADGAFELLSELKRTASDAEVIVMAERTSMAAAIHWFDPDAFALVRKTDIVQLFAAVTRALERRRMAAQNRRLVWELQTINEIAAGITRSLELEDVLGGALQRVVVAMDAVGGSIRLRDELTGKYEVRAQIGPRLIQSLFTDRIHRPSDRVIATGEPCVLEDVADLVGEGADPRAVPVRSAISVPMHAGEKLLGTLTIGSARPRRFQTADQQLLATIVGHIVVAIENAQLHHSIRRAKREWEQTFDAINDPIAVFDGSGVLLRGNHALAGLIGVPVTTLRQLTCAQVGFCGADGCPDCRVGRAVSQREQSRAEVTLANGQIYSVTTFPIGMPSAGPSVVQIAKNVTEEIRSARRLQQMSNELAGTNGRLIAAMDQLKSTQAQLLQAEKLSAIGHLVAGVAHELNNPLTSVIGYAQLVEEELREGPITRPTAEVAQDMRRIAEESERAARIVRNLLAFARRQSVSRVPQDLGEIAERVLALREYEFRMSGIALHTDCPSGTPQVLADSGQMQQLLLNLVLNAEQAMRGGEVKRLAVAIRHDEDAGAIELSVTDSGHGIEAPNLSRIFDPFFTTREVGEGTGLGLSICYGIVRDHGGHIHVESKPRVGTTVRVLLPARLAGAAARDTQVLVAHPDSSEREFMAAALSGWGYGVVSAAAPEEALDGYARPAVQIAIVDGSFIAADLAAWRTARSEDSRDVMLILTSVAPEDRATEQFGREEAAAALVPPFELRALHSAIRAGFGLKECV